MKLIIKLYLYSLPLSLLAFYVWRSEDFILAAITCWVLIKALVWFYCIYDGLGKCFKLFGKKWDWTTLVFLFNGVGIYIYVFGGPFMDDSKNEYHQ